MKIKELKKYFGANNYLKGYKELFEFFCKDRNFEHRQGSVYCSKNRMKLLEVTKILDELINNCPWLKNCLRIMDITEIGDVHEVTEIITENAKIN